MGAEGFQVWAPIRLISSAGILESATRFSWEILKVPERIFPGSSGSAWPTTSNALLKIAYFCTAPVETWYWALNFCAVRRKLSPRSLLLLCLYWLNPLILGGFFRATFSNSYCFPMRYRLVSSEIFRRPSWLLHIQTIAWSRFSKGISRTAYGIWSRLHIS